MAAPNEITVAQLLRLIGTPECPVIVDISVDPDLEDDPYLIPSSVRLPHTDLPGLKSGLAGRACVITCQKGIKLSQGLTAWLRGDGIDAQYLQGGMYGWRDAGAPRVPASALPDPVAGATLWVTRHRPKIDRIACPWLIRRFVDPGARVLFVSPGEVKGVADRYAATPFDVMLDEFELRTAALDRLSHVIRRADTNSHDLAPEAAGLLAISVGLSPQFRDDHSQLNTGLMLYDALYRWARDGACEGHDWPAGRAA